MAELDDIRELREELYKAREQLAAAKLRTRTILSPDHFLALCFCLPLIGSFTVLGIVLVWKASSNPESVAPYLQDMLLALSIFSNPVSAITGAVVARWSKADPSPRKGGSDEED